MEDLEPEGPGLYQQNKGAEDELWRQTKPAHWTIVGLIQDRSPVQVRPEAWDSTQRQTPEGWLKPLGRWSEAYQAPTNTPQ